MDPVRKINGHTFAQLDNGESQDYNSLAIDNYYFLKFVTDCLSGKVSADVIEETIGVLKLRMKDIQEKAKLKQGEESYPGLMIRR